MRIWSIHPSYLDTKGLVALWREALLAQKVLLGKTKGYTHHPQLIRFKNQKNPVLAIGVYLLSIYNEAASRGFSFDREKISETSFQDKIPVTRGQLEFEWDHFKEKVKNRDSRSYQRIKNVVLPKAHPLFRIIKGNAEFWEKGWKK
jgi:hypothetical protein